MKQSVNRAGIWLIVFSLPYLVVGIIAFFGYSIFNTQLDAMLLELNDLPSELLESFAGIDQILALLESVILGIAVISFLIWLMMVIIGIINLRRV